MGFVSLLVAASTPVAEVFLVAVLGAYLGQEHVKVLTPSARADMNRVVYAVFTPALVLASLARTVTLEDAVSWWFMPVNIGVIFLAGGVLGWVVVLVLRPPQHLRGLIMASCSAPNLGNLLLIVIPAVCHENDGFNVDGICTDRGLSYASFSMALGGLYIWTHTQSVMKRSSCKHDDDPIPKEDSLGAVSVEEDEEQQPLLQHDPPRLNMWVEKLKQGARHIVDELAAPPTVGAVVGFSVGAVPWVRSLFIGTQAPLRVLHDSLKLLGDGTIPCVTLILGGNLTKGVGKTAVSPWLVAAIICVRYVVLPVLGVAMVSSAHKLGFLPPDPLYQYVLMLQFALPPAMSIGTMAQLYDVAQEECSVIFLWTYLVAALALTAWSTVFMSILAA